MILVKWNTAKVVSGGQLLHINLDISLDFLGQCVQFELIFYVKC